MSSWGDLVYYHNDIKKNRPSSSHLSICTFNVERGYNFCEQGTFLLEHQHDIVLLQEVDIGCKRTKGANVFHRLAEAAEMRCGVWACEFEEIDSPARSAHLAGGGHHGNAILVRNGRIIEAGSIIHRKLYNWESNTSQPRRGGRVTCWADVELEGLKSVLRVYCSHFENFCGPLERLEQLQEVAEHAIASGRENVSIGGDFNTLMHGWVRFLPLLYPSRDWWQRITSLGYSEAEWWQRHVFDDPNASVTGMSQETLNFFSQFRDPFDKGSSGRTFTNAINVYCAKLDWILVPKTWAIVEAQIGGEGLSDHLALWVKVKTF